MGFKCGIVGLPNVGKSTLFNALTNSSKAQAENFPFCTIDPNIGIVPVPDKRLDRLVSISNSIKKINRRVKLIRFGNNHGQSAAFAAGFKAARGEIFVTLDADLQNNPADIPLLLEKMEEFVLQSVVRHLIVLPKRIRQYLNYMARA